MNTRDEKYSVVLMDLPGRVLPNPAAAAFTLADLMHAAGKARQFYSDTAAEAEAAAAGAFIPCLRRRRR